MVPQIPVEVLNRIDQKWHKDVLALMETGKASPKFLKLLDSDRNVQETFELLFDLSTSDIRELLQS
jgi:hypothetical protein